MSLSLLVTSHSRSLSPSHDFLDYIHLSCFRLVPCDRRQGRIAAVRPVHIRLRIITRERLAGEPEAQMTGRISHFLDRIVIMLQAEAFHLEMREGEMFSRLWHIEIQNAAIFLFDKISLHDIQGKV